MATPWQPMATVPYPRDGKPFVFWRVNPQVGYPQWDVAPSHVVYEEALALGEPPATHWMRPAAPILDGVEPEPSQEAVTSWLRVRGWTAQADAIDVAAELAAAHSTIPKGGR